MGKGQYDNQSIHDQQAFDAWYEKQDLKGDALIAAMRERKASPTLCGTGLASGYLNHNFPKDTNGVRVTRREFLNGGF